VIFLPTPEKNTMTHRMKKYLGLFFFFISTITTVTTQADWSIDPKVGKTQRHFKMRSYVNLDPDAKLKRISSFQSEQSGALFLLVFLSSESETNSLKDFLTSRGIPLRQVSHQNPRMISTAVRRHGTEEEVDQFLDSIHAFEEIQSEEVFRKIKSTARADQKELFHLYNSGLMRLASRLSAPNDNEQGSRFIGSRVNTRAPVVDTVGRVMDPIDPDDMMPIGISYLQQVQPLSTPIPRLAASDILSQTVESLEDLEGLTEYPFAGEE
jgi:hypothetical protein